MADPQLPPRERGPRRSSFENTPPPVPGQQAPGMRGFRDIAADADDLGRAAAQANRNARKTYANVPSPSPEFDRLEPNMENRGADPEQPYAWDDHAEDTERSTPPSAPQMPEPPPKRSRIGSASEREPKRARAGAVFPFKSAIVIGVVLILVGAGILWGKSAATNHNTRHPLITGSWATTMHRLSGGRFTLGVGRGIAAIYGAFGIPAVTTAQMEDWAQVMRRLWHGEVIFNHDGPMGKYPILFLDPDFKEDIRLALVAFGPNTLALGGRVFDDVILHTYFTPETLQRCVTTVKSAAEKAGRDPDSVRVWSCFATVGDHLPEQLRLKKTVARLATYLQGYGDLLVQTNNWDPAVLQRFRADSVVTSIAGGIDHKATPEQIEHIATLIPDEWLEPSATGSAQQCVDRIRKEFDYGADALIMHGATPDELEPVVAAYRAT